MKRNRKVKILATLGPASAEEEMIQKLHEAGADLFRINMSHASHDLMRTLISRIRSVEARCGRPIGILADLQGPKLRVGKFKDGKADLAAGPDLHARQQRGARRQQACLPAASGNPSGASSRAIAC